MFAKLMICAATVLAAALFAYLGDRLITAYGDARYQSGLADGQLRQVPIILAADQRATQAGLDARDRVIAANGARDATLARLIPQILSAQNKVTTYAASVAGRAACLGPDRVWGIEADRSTLFSTSTPDIAGGDPAGSVPADAATGPAGS